MAGDGGLHSGRGRFRRYFSWLYSGQELPPDRPPAPPPPAPPDDAVRGPDRGIDRFHAGMPRTLPPGIAGLIVCTPEGAAGDARRFRLKAVCCNCTPLSDLGVEYEGPDLVLGTNDAPGGPSPIEFLAGMGLWSYEKGVLTEWLNLRRHYHADKLELVVCDSGRFRIPWELLWLPSKPEAGLPDGYLGALVTVIRWLELEEPYRPEYVRPYSKVNPHENSGPVLAYIAHDMGYGGEILPDFEVCPAGSLTKLFKILAGQEVLNPDLAAFAMVYVACRSDFCDDPKRCVLGGFHLGLAALFSDNLPKLRAQPTLVFLNGCRTDVVGIDIRKYNGEALRGFAEVFLRSGAAGVLAATGALDEEQAKKLPDTLIRYLGRHRELSVPDGLRHRRAAAARRLRKLLFDEQQHEDDELLEHLYPFMYVYFGSPRMSLPLAEGAGTGELAGTGG